MQRLDTATPVQVIAVPEISMDRITQRFVDARPPQRAEQLWKCRQTLLIPCWSLPLLFMVGSIAFKVFTQNRVQQHRSLPSRSLKFQFRVDIFKVLAQDTVYTVCTALLSRSLDIPAPRGWSGGWWRSSRFSPETGFFSFILIAWCLE